MKKILTLLMAMSLLMFSLEALAKPLLTVNMKAETEVTLNNQTTKVAVKEINPGDVVVYTINYVNTGDEAATSANLDDPIPKGTVYIPGSATGDKADITFSIDDGKTFKKPSLLTYEIKLANGKVEKKVASPEQYTNIRWTINTIPARGKGEVSFKVKVK
jgi:uncharacterized repeat protein (TIGR01451 family)